MTKDKSNRRQINVRLEEELYEFLVQYAKSNYKTVTAVIRENIADLYRESRKAPLVVKEEEQG